MVADAKASAQQGDSRKGPSRESFSGAVASRFREEGTDEQKLLMGAIEKW